MLSPIRARSETVPVCLQWRPSVPGLLDKRQHQAQGSPPCRQLTYPGSQTGRTRFANRETDVPMALGKGELPHPSHSHLFLCIPCSCNTVHLHAVYKIPSVRTGKCKCSGAGKAGLGCSAVIEYSPRMLKARVPSPHPRVPSPVS